MPLTYLPSTFKLFKNGYRISPELAERALVEGFDSIRPELTQQIGGLARAREMYEVFADTYNRYVGTVATYDIGNMFYVKYADEFDQKQFQEDFNKQKSGLDLDEISSEKTEQIGSLTKAADELEGSDDSPMARLAAAVIRQFNERAEAEQFSSPYGKPHSFAEGKLMNYVIKRDASLRPGILEIVRGIVHFEFEKAYKADAPERTTKP